MGKRRVSRFCPKYLEQEIGGVPNKLWLRGDSTHPDRLEQNKIKYTLFLIGKTF